LLIFGTALVALGSIGHFMRRRDEYEL
jgi:hypothetical protein